MAASVAEQLADGLQRARASSVAFRGTAEKLLIDIAGLCVAARGMDYTRAALQSWESGGKCTAIGHARALDAAGAAFVNGTAAHGEDFDDTFEGGPVHAGAVIVPAILAVSEREKISGADALCGLAVGATRERVVEAVRAFEHGARADEAGAREIRGADSRLRGPSRVKALGPGAFGEVLDDAGCHRSGDSKRIYKLRR